jgi:hypothetical protein
MSGNVGLPSLPTADLRNLLYGASGDRVIYPGMELDVVPIQHTLEVQRRDGTLEFDPVGCCDLSISYEIYAEDMPTVRATLSISSTELLTRLDKASL